MGIHRGPNIVTDGLVLALDASSTRSWTPGSSTWKDISGNNNNATLFNSPSTGDTGLKTQHIILNGTNQYAQITANETSLSFKNGQTIGMLFQSSDTALRPVLWDQAYGGYGTITLEGAGIQLNYYRGSSGINGGTYTSYNSGAIPRSTWIYVVLTRDSSFCTWYKDGVSNTPQTETYTPMSVTTTANIRLGLGYTGNYLNGKLIFVHAYNRGLTADEVAQNYNAFKNRYI